MPILVQYCCSPAAFFCSSSPNFKQCVCVYLCMNSVPAAALYAAASVACSLITAGVYNGYSFPAKLEPVVELPAVQAALDRAAVLLAQQAAHTMSGGNAHRPPATPDQASPEFIGGGGSPDCVCECGPEREAAEAAEVALSETKVRVEAVGVLLIERERDLWRWQFGCFFLMLVLSLLWYWGSRGHSRLRHERTERARMASELDRMASAVSPPSMGSSLVPLAS